MCGRSAFCYSASTWSVSALMLQQSACLFLTDRLQVIQGQLPNLPLLQSRNACTSDRDKASRDSQFDMHAPGRLTPLQRISSCRSVEPVPHDHSVSQTISRACLHSFVELHSDSFRPRYGQSEVLMITHCSKAPGRPTPLHCVCTCRSVGLKSFSRLRLRIMF